MPSKDRPATGRRNRAETIKGVPKPATSTAWGITLFETLTGKCPFVEANERAMAAAHVEQQPPDPRTLVPQLGPRAARLLRALLAKDPAERPTASQLIDRLVDLEIDTLQERIPA